MLWEYGGYASEGVRQVAEFGSPIKMEEEIRQKVGRRSLEASVSLYFHVAKLNPCLSRVQSLTVGYNRGPVAKKEML